MPAGPGGQGASPRQEGGTCQGPAGLNRSPAMGPEAVAVAVPTAGGSMGICSSHKLNCTGRAGFK